MKPEDLTENSVLLGSPAHITDVLKKVEAAGFSEVILYFNVGMKPHTQERKRWIASCERSLRHSTEGTNVTRRERVSSPKSSASGSESGDRGRRTIWEVVSCHCSKVPIAFRPRLLAA